MACVLPPHRRRHGHRGGRSRGARRSARVPARSRRGCGAAQPPRGRRRETGMIDRTAEQVASEDFENDPEYRAEWERTALAREVSEAITHYRVHHGLTQTALAQRLGLRQSAVARLGG